MAFIVLPIVSWIVCGTLKFVVNATKNERNPFSLIGHGGFPSNHTAVISSIMWGFLFTGQWHNAGLALAILMIVVFDATALRREVGRHAAALNQLTGSHFRELMGHRLIDVAAGFLVGLAVAAAVCSVW